jgi:hypothetical protein
VLQDDAPGLGMDGEHKQKGRGSSPGLNLLHP